MDVGHFRENPVITEREKYSSQIAGKHIVNDIYLLYESQ